MIINKKIIKIFIIIIFILTVSFSVVLIKNHNLAQANNCAIDTDLDSLDDCSDFSPKDMSCGASETSVCACDVNGDGVVSFSDATAYLSYNIAALNYTPDTSITNPFFERLNIGKSWGYGHWVNVCLN